MKWVSSIVFRLNVTTQSLSHSLHRCMMGKIKEKKKTIREMNLSSKHEIWIYFDTSFGYIPLSIYISPSKSIQSATHQSHFVIHVAYEQFDHLISLMLRFASGNLSTPAVEKHNIFLVYPQFPHHTHSCSVFIYLFDWIRIILPCRGKKKAPKIVD